MPSAASSWTSGISLLEHVLPREVGAGALEDLDLHLFHAQLAAQPHQLGALVRGEPFLAAFVDVGLAHPVAQAALADPEVLGDLSDRLLPQPRELDRATPELRSMWCWH
jgi:hypothetical protein